MVNSINITESLIGLRKLVMYICLYFVIVDNVTNKRQFNWVIWTVILVAGIVSLDGFFQFFSGKDLMRGRSLMLPGEGIKRVTAAFEQASVLGIYLGTLTPVVVSLTLYHFSGKKKLLIGLWAFFMLLCLVLSLAPGAIFGFYAAMLFFIILKRDRRLLLVLIIGIILARFILPSVLINWPEGTLFSSIRGRIDMCQIAMKMIKIHPFLGMGLHTFPINYQSYVLPGGQFYGTGMLPYAHNIYFHMAAEIGLIGLAVFIWLLVTLIRGCYSAYKKTESSYLKALSLGLLGGIIAFLTHGMLESSLYMSQGGILFWFMVGLNISLQRIIHAKPEMQT
jgi:O-antigen ligase